MIEMFGIPLGTVFQGGTFAALIAAFITALGIWFKYGPDRTRADNETKVIENADAAALRAAFDELNLLNRKDIHDLRNRLGIVTAEQHQTQRELNESQGLNREYRDDMDTMLFLIRLLISEVKRLDKNPDNIIIQQAEQVLAQLVRKKPITNPLQSDALNTAETAVKDAKQTVISATATCEEVKSAESGTK